MLDWPAQLATAIVAIVVALLVCLAAKDVLVAMFKAGPLRAVIAFVAGAAVIWLMMQIFDVPAMFDTFVAEVNQQVVRVPVPAPLVPPPAGQ